MEIEINLDGEMCAIIEPVDMHDTILEEFWLNCLIQKSRAHIFFKADEDEYREAVNDMENWVLKIIDKREEI